MGRLTTHVLDTMAGKPAAGPRHRAMDGGRGRTAAQDGDHQRRRAGGRASARRRRAPCRALRAAVPCRGVSLRAHHGVGADPLFLDEIPIRFGIADPDQHYHVPLLLSALRVLDLPGEAEPCRAGVSASSAAAGSSSGRTSLRPRPCSTISGSTSVRAAPRKAARRATAAPVTVAVGRLDGDGRIAYEPVNSCILLLGMVDGTEIVTVEDLASSNGRLHPVQRALVDAHASPVRLLHPGVRDEPLHPVPRRKACGSGRRERLGSPATCAAAPATAPIADAALACCTGEADDAFTRRAAETASQLTGLSDEADVFAGAGDTFFAAPATEDALAALCARYPDATHRRRRDGRGPVDHQAAPRAAAHRAHRPASPPCTRCGRWTTGSRSPPPPPTPKPWRRSAASIRMWARCCAAWARSRCGAPAPSAGTSPTAHPSAIRRRC